MPPVKTHAWAKEFLAESAAAGGNELAGGAEYYFVQWAVWEISLF